MELLLLFLLVTIDVATTINSFNGNIIVVDGPYPPMSLMGNAGGVLDPTDGHGNIVVRRGFASGR